MKITFIHPGMGKKAGHKYIGTWKMEPLTYAVLKALLPPQVETEFFDDRIELIDYETATDIVMMSVETYTARRAYAISARFRKRGIKVILGGYHVTAMPDEAKQYCDCIVTGNAETVMAQLLEDCRNRALKDIYAGENGYVGNLQPDRTVYSSKKYLPLALAETGRGCFHKCDFCSITSYYSCKYYKRDIAQIVEDIKNSGRKYHFLIDDNLMADKENAKKLFEALIPLKIKWVSQGTINMGSDAAMLKLMKRSGCEVMLIGFESLCNDNLRLMNKNINLSNTERDTLIKNIHKAGIGIYATFVFGYDNDTEKTFDDTFAFAKKHKFYIAAFNHLLPLPCTPLFERLKAEGRLLQDKWWLDGGYYFGDVAFAPKNMTAERLSELCQNARRKYSNFGNIVKRGFAALGRSGLLRWWLFWAVNRPQTKDIIERMRVPLGENLDELPK